MALAAKVAPLNLAGLRRVHREPTNRIPRSSINLDLFKQWPLLSQLRYSPLMLASSSDSNARPRIGQASGREGREARYSPSPCLCRATPFLPRFRSSIHSSPSHHFNSIFSRSNNANTALVAASHPFAWLRIPIRQPIYILFFGLSSSFLVFFLGLLENPLATETAPRSANLPASRFSSPSFSWTPLPGLLTRDSSLIPHTRPHVEHAVALFLGSEREDNTSFVSHSPVCFTAARRIVTHLYFDIPPAFLSASSAIRSLTRSPFRVLRNRSSIIHANRLDIRADSNAEQYSTLDILHFILSNTRLGRYSTSQPIMRPANYLPRPGLLLSAFTSVSIYGAIVMAQDDKEKESAAPAPAATNKDDNKDADKNSEASKPSATAAEPAKPSNTDNKDENKSEDKAQSKTEEEEPASTKEESKPTTTQDKKPSSTQEKDEPSSSTEEDEPTSTKDDPTSTTDIQSKITSIKSISDSVETGMPTLTKLKPIPTYPAATVPPTKNAPFMQHSSAPDGTVFIAVGAILGALGAAILLWRLIVGILLHRSVERAAKAQHDANAKQGFPAPPAPFYKYTDTGSTMSLAAGRGVRRTTRGPVLSSTPSASNLFFSPTAAASGNGGAGNRGSAFLPSGFYAAGTSSPGGSHEHSISLTNLRPDSRGQFGNPSRHTLNITPPESPSVNPRRDISGSSLNLNRPPSQRAPSAFLEDLLADDPSSLPPPQMPASSGRHSSYGSGSPGGMNRF